MQNAELILIIALSWGLIWLYERADLGVLGGRPTLERLKIGTILFVVTALCCASGFWMRTYFVQEQFALNPQISLELILMGIWLNFKSVLFEELLCRGVGLYILIKKLGQKWAIVISALVFGLLHILNGNALSNPVQTGLLFLYTFLMGLLLAYAFAKTRSIYAPFAIHFGWNLTQNFVFPGGPFGDFLLLSTAQPEVTVSYFVYFLMLLFPKVSAICIDYLYLKKLPLAR